MIKTTRFCSGAEPWRSERVVAVQKAVVFCFVSILIYRLYSVSQWTIEKKTEEHKPLPLGTEAMEIIIGTRMLISVSVMGNGMELMMRAVDVNLIFFFTFPSISFRYPRGEFKDYGHRYSTELLKSSVQLLQSLQEFSLFPPFPILSIPLSSYCRK